MSSQELRFGLIAPLLDLCRRLEDERELAAGTLAQLDVAAHDRFVRSAAKRKFAKEYGSILQLIEDPSALVSVDPDVLSDALISRLAVLREGADPVAVTREDPLVAEFFDRLRHLESTLLDADKSETKETGDHRYQLVIQFAETFRLDDLGCEDIGDAEDWVADALGNPTDDPDATHLVDGNAFGTGTIEIFVNTNEPQDALRRLRRHAQGKGLEREMIVAFRDFDTDVYTVIWPEGDTRPFDPT